MNEETHKIFEEHIFEEIEIKPDTVVLESRSNVSPKKTFIEKIIATILVGFVFLLPVFFLPLNGVFSGLAKNILLSAVVISSLLLMCLLWIKEVKIVVPRNRVFLALGGLVVLYSLSSFFSGAFQSSFFGTGAEITTSLEMLLLVLLTFLFAVFFRTKERLVSVFLAIFASSAFVFLFQVFHILFPGLTVTGIAADKSANLIGLWSDLGIFSGLIIIVSLISLEKLRPSDKTIRTALYVFLAVALLFHSLSFYSNSWIILGVIALSLSVFSFFQHARSESNSIVLAQKWMSTPSFVVAILSAVFIFAGPFINTKLSEVLNIPPMQDVRPSWSGTNQIFMGLFSEHGKDAVIGIGPNRFYIPWQKYRAQEINYTPWWNVDFNEGVGTIPSSSVTVGVLGFLGWISFLLVFFIGGVRILRKKFSQMDSLTQYFAMTSFVGASFSWVVAFTNDIGVVPFTLAFIFTGLFIGTLSSCDIPQVREYFYLSNPKKGFILMIVMLLLFGAFTWFGYLNLNKTRSTFAYRNAVIAGGAGNMVKADAEFRRAIALAPNDTYYRSLSTLNSYQAQQLISRTDLSPDDLRAQFGTAFQESIKAANQAVAIDGANYLNWVTLGNAYSVLVPLNIKDISDNAYTQTKGSYEKAWKQNPLNPQIPYALANIALSRNKVDEAVDYIIKAIQLKNDYTDAIVLLAQIKDGTGKSEEALAVMEQASTFISDPMILFQLGYLRYKNEKYELAASALEKVVKAVPDYSNAKYFLGLSYFKFGRTNDAIKELQDVARLNPDRADITKIISNMKNGYALFDAPAPKPEVSTSTKASTVKKKK